MDIKNSDLLQTAIKYVENLEFFDNIKPKADIKEEEGFDEKIWKSLQLDVKPKLEKVEASETGPAKIKIEPKEVTSNDERETLSNEFIDIKDEFIWTMKNFVVKPKLEQEEASETGQVKIKTEPVEFVDNDKTETLCNESIDIKDEFMWTMKDFVSDNVPPSNLEQQIAAVHEKKEAFACSMCPYNVARKDQLDRHIAAVHEKKKPFVCSFCHSKFGWKGQLKKHIDAVHGKRNPLECSLCPYTFGSKYLLNKHIAIVHEEKKPYVCSICPSMFFQRSDLNNHINAEHKQENPFACSLCPYRFGQKEHLDRHIAAVHEKKKPFECSLCPRKFGLEDHLMKHNDAVHKKTDLYHIHELDQIVKRVKKDTAMKNF